MDEYERHFYTLGLSPGASADEITAAWRVLAKKYHPDFYANCPEQKAEANARFLAIQEAYDALRNRPAGSFRASDEVSTDPDPAPNRPYPPKERPSRGERGTRDQAPRPAHTTRRPAASPLSQRPRFTAGAVVVFLFVALKVVGAIVRSNSDAQPPQISPTADRQSLKDSTASLMRSIDGLRSYTKARPRGKSVSKLGSPVTYQRPIEDKQDAAQRAQEAPPRMAGPTGDTPAFFTLGSTKQQVRAIQGNPSTAGNNLWFYGDSLVRFEDGKVVEYSNVAGGLRIEMKPWVQRASRNMCFGVGSSDNRVLSLQGTPSSVKAGVWRYGASVVRFEDGTVQSYSNAGNNLAVVPPRPPAARTAEAWVVSAPASQARTTAARQKRAKPATVPAKRASAKPPAVPAAKPGGEPVLVFPQPSFARPFFTIGSTEAEVRRIQGTPDSYSSGGALWWYGLSYVKFRGGRVVEYSNGSGTLHIKLEPRSSQATRRLNYFTIGSTTDHVLHVQGTPDSYSSGGALWWYGSAIVRFSGGRVVSYTDSNKTLRVRPR